MGPGTKPGGGSPAETWVRVDNGGIRPGAHCGAAVIVFTTEARRHGGRRISMGTARTYGLATEVTEITEDGNVDSTDPRAAFLRVLRVSVVKAVDVYGSARRHHG